MLTQIHNRLWVGDMQGHDRGQARVHICKSPCHQQFANYKGNLPKDHPDYLWKERGVELALNVVDAPIPIFRAECFVRGMDFIARWPASTDVVIHDNKGQSRAPVLAALYLAKRAQVIPDTWEQAHSWLFHRVPDLKVGLGLATWMEQHWEEVR